MTLEPSGVRGGKVDSDLGGSIKPEPYRQQWCKQRIAKAQPVAALRKCSYLPYLRNEYCGWTKPCTSSLANRWFMPVIRRFHPSPWLRGFCLSTRALGTRLEAIEEGYPANIPLAPASAVCRLAVLCKRRIKTLVLVAWMLGL